MSRLAQLVERKTLNLVVVGSSPTVGVASFVLVCFVFFPDHVLARAIRGCRVRASLAPVAQLAARRSHNPKVASSILAGSIYIFFV